MESNKEKAVTELLRKILNAILRYESTEQIGAEPYERTPERKVLRSGTYQRWLNTRAGSLELDVPRHRNGEAFKTELFERYQRSEQALLITMMEMVINGVSPRKVEKITEELCGRKFSKSTVSELYKSLDPLIEEFRNRPLEGKYPFIIVDAIYLKIREDNRVLSKGLLVAVGINEEGMREVKGFQIADTENETCWGEFFESLKNRGLNGVRLITSDEHKGLVKAIRKYFQGASWQRCQTHFSRNMLDKTPKSLQPELEEDLHWLYEAVDIESARRIRDQIIEKYQHKAPKATALLDKAFNDITSVLPLPLKYRKRLRTTNSLERLNEEIRRRERVVRIFPNEASVIRLIGAILMEQNEKWQTGRKYLDMEQFYQSIENLDNSTTTDNTYMALVT